MPRKGQIPAIRDCSTPGCKGVAHAKGLCLSCYSTALRKAKREREQKAETAA